LFSPEFPATTALIAALTVLLIVPAARFKVPDARVTAPSSKVTLPAAWVPLSVTTYEPVTSFPALKATLSAVVVVEVRTPPLRPELSLFQTTLVPHVPGAVEPLDPFTPLVAPPTVTPSLSHHRAVAQDVREPSTAEAKNNALAQRLRGLHARRLLDLLI